MPKRPAQMLTLLADAASLMLASNQRPGAGPRSGSDLHDLAGESQPA